MAKKAKKVEPEVALVGATLQVSAKDLAALARPFSFFKGGIEPDFHVKLQGSNVILSASNGACRLARVLPASNSVEVTVEGRLGVDMFTKSIAQLSGIASLSIVDSKMVVSQEGRVYRHTVDDGGVQPEFMSDGVGRIPINGASFKRMLGVCAANCSTDQIRPAMNGVFLTIHEGFLEAWGTDGHRMIVYRIPSTAEGLKMIVPSDVARLAASLAGESVVLYWNESTVGFEFETGKLEAAVIQEPYPDARAVMGRTVAATTESVVVTAADVRSALKTSRIFSPQGSPGVIVRIRGSQADVLAGDVDMAVSMKQGFAVEGEAPEIMIAVNSNYLLTAMDLMLGDRVVLSFDPADATKAMKLKPMDSGEDIVMIVMPQSKDLTISRMGPEVAEYLRKGVAA